MGATFDRKLLNRIGDIIGTEALVRNIHVVLAPTVCVHRSPLQGRAFEAFSEDPTLSGILGAEYIKGIQRHQVAACIKHYAAHDQSERSPEDNIIATERTLRETHLLPFQIAQKLSRPLAYMTAYNKINGTHASEDPWLINKVLRQEWGFDGLVISDWWGTYSTSEAINAGLDIEMPGPTVWRANNMLSYAVDARKVSQETIDSSVRRVLTLISKVYKPPSTAKDQDFNTLDSQLVAKKAATDSIVLLKNERGVLPLDQNGSTTVALIGDHFKSPATGGGGSSEATPYYVSKPFDAIVEYIGMERIQTEVGCYSHKFLPLLTEELTQPSGKAGLYCEMFEKDPTENSDTECIWTAETTKSLLQFTDTLPLHLPSLHYMRIRTIFTAGESTLYRFGLSVFGKAKMSIDGDQVIDLWKDHPEKNDTTPVFNAFSMERFHDLHLERGRKYNIEVILCNVFTSKIIGAAPAGGIRLGGCKVLDEDRGIRDAVTLAKNVDVPIIMTGLSSDYEMESMDRKHMHLPGRLDELIERVTDANPNTVVINQSGMPVSMPWASKVGTLLHAWYGGQETGHGIADILFGKVNPSGKLSVTFPHRIEDTPAFLNFAKSDHNIIYGEGVFLGHRYYEKVDRPPLFYFGHGLSYTKFNYFNLVVPSIFEGKAEHVMHISVDITNIGDVRGAEVVQLYIGDPKCSVQRPKRELKTFSKLELDAGESHTCHLELDKYAVSFWSEEHSKWRAEAGSFIIFLAKSANPDDVIFEKEFTLQETFMWVGV
jgi:beta-glucosidase